MEVLEVDFGKPNAEIDPFKALHDPKLWAKLASIKKCPHCGATKVMHVVCDCNSLECGYNAYLNPNGCKTSYKAARDYVSQIQPKWEDFPDGPPANCDVEVLRQEFKERLYPKEKDGKVCTLP
jgi:hypothetical protein